MKQRERKKAILISLLSTVICLAMFIGSTFAWFTDSVQTGSNTIIAGSLDIELEYTKTPDDQNSWQKIDGATDLFSDVTLWEPGATGVCYMRISNLGTLALNYFLTIEATDKVVGKTKSGESIRLSDILVYGVVDGVKTTFTSRQNAIDQVLEPKKLSQNYYHNGQMMATEEKEYFAVVVYMPQDVGNEANYFGSAIPQVDLSIKFVATQMSSESDSFSTQYDQNADSGLTFDSKGEYQVNGDYMVTKPDGIAVKASGEGTIVNITGGNFNGGSLGNNVCVTSTNGATINISGGTFTVGHDKNGQGNSVIYAYGGDINISGGTFYTDYDYNGKYYVLNQNNNLKGNITVTGGSFRDYNPSLGDDNLEGSFVPDGYQVIADSQSDPGRTWYTVVKI